MKTCENIIGFKTQELKLLESSNFSNKNAMRFLKWFLKNAESFHDVDLKKSEKIANEVDSTIKQCYHNCWKAVVEPKNYLRYFEGFVWSKNVPLPLEHSWLVGRNNKVIDPTLILDPKKHGFPEIKSKNRIGDEYLGVEFPIKTLNKFVFLHKRTGSFLPELFLSGEL